MADERTTDGTLPPEDARARLMAAARHALADLAGLHRQGGLAPDAKRTVAELYEALAAAGADVIDYAGEYAEVKEDLAEAGPPAPA